MRRCSVDVAISTRCLCFGLHYLVWMWKLLVVPVCSKSWIAAANTIARISNSLSQCCKHGQTQFTVRRGHAQVVALWCECHREHRLPSVRCATWGSEQSEWRRRRESGCGRGSCICCIHSPELQQTAPEPALESKNTSRWYQMYCVSTLSSYRNVDPVATHSSPVCLLLTLVGGVKSYSFFFATLY